MACIVSAPLKQALPPRAQEWAGIPASSPCPAVRPPATCGRDAAVSHMLCSQLTHIVPRGTCYMSHAVGSYIAIIARMMQGDTHVNKHTRWVPRPRVLRSRDESSRLGDRMQAPRAHRTRGCSSVKCTVYISMSQNLVSGASCTQITEDFKEGLFTFLWVTFTVA